MKPTVVADEMFPEGAGPYMDLEEVTWWNNAQIIFRLFDEGVQVLILNLNRCLGQTVLRNVYINSTLIFFLQKL
jgi:hypothetical protein